MNIALIGDKIHCPHRNSDGTSHGEGTIVSTDQTGPGALWINGRRAACEGDNVVCGDGTQSRLPACMSALMVNGYHVHTAGNEAGHGGIILGSTPHVYVQEGCMDFMNITTPWHLDGAETACFTEAGQAPPGFIGHDPATYLPNEDTPRHVQKVINQHVAQGEGEEAYTVRETWQQQGFNITPGHLLIINLGFFAVGQRDNTPLDWAAIDVTLRFEGKWRQGQITAEGELIFTDFVPELSALELSFEHQNGQVIYVTALGNKPTDSPLNHCTLTATHWNDEPPEEDDFENKIYRLELQLLQPLMISPQSGQYLLSESELAYCQGSDNNATVFIHGFGVEYGQFGSYMPAGEQAYTTFPDTSYGTLLRKAESDETAEQANGSGAHNWAIHMEHNLNVAAGFDGKDTRNFQRLIHFTWDACAASPLDYMAIVENADKAATERLVPLLKQLLDKKIKVNILAHSLGNQVLLRALDTLGQDKQYSDAIEHSFLWEAAVPDDSLSSPAKNNNLSEQYRFPNAAKATQKITVLYSGEDNVLGPIDTQHTHYWAKVTDPTAGLLSAFMEWAMQLVDKHGSDNRVAIRSVYNFANIFGFSPNYLLESAAHRENYYKQWRKRCKKMINGQKLKSTLSEQLTYINENYGAHYTALGILLTGEKGGVGSGIFQMAKDLYHEISHAVAKFAANSFLRSYEELLQFVSPSLGKKIDAFNQQHTKLDPDVQDTAGLMITVLLSQGPEPEPALGYGGPDKNSKTTIRLENKGKLFKIDQKDYLTSHSAMKIPSPALMEHIYKGRLFSKVDPKPAFKYFGLWCEKG